MDPAPAELSRRRLLRLASLAVAAPPLLAACGSEAATESTGGSGDGTVLQTGEDSGLSLTPSDEGVDEGVDETAEGDDAAAADPTSGDSEPTGPGTDIAFTYLDGTPGTIADFAGKPTVLNFFASWCPPCRQEMPDFEEAHQIYKDRVNFVGLATNDEGDAAADLVEETGVTYPVGLDPDQNVYATYGGIAMPTTIFLDANGNVAETWFGIIIASDLDIVINSLL